MIGFYQLALLYLVSLTDQSRDASQSPKQTGLRKRRHKHKIRSDQTLDITSTNQDTQQATIDATEADNKSTLKEKAKELL